METDEVVLKRILGDKWFRIDGWMVSVIEKLEERELLAVLDTGYAVRRLPQSSGGNHEWNLN